MSSVFPTIWTHAFAVIFIAMSVLWSRGFVASAADRGDSSARASLCEAGKWRGWKRSIALDNPSGASVNTYNFLAWSAGAGAIHLGAEPPGTARWSTPNGFDDSIRDALRADSPSGRSSAATASDVLLYAAIAGPLVGVGKSWSEGDCDEAFDLTARAAEAMALTAFITQSVKIIAGRQRPDRAACVVGCDDGSDSRESFFSGHASFAATGAGLVCGQSIKRKTWGDGMFQRAVPCAFGIGVAIAVGVLRVSSDKHWASDVLAGWAVGSLVGYFDVPGPFDLLRFRLRGRDGGKGAEGVALPYMADGAFGVRLSLRF